MSLSQADVEAVRVRARRRLIGMAVLVGAGVIGFPWLFETKPRPMAMDIAVVQQGASTPSVPAAIAAKPGVQAKVKSVTQPVAPREEVIEDSAKSASSKTSDSRMADVKLAKGAEPSEKEKKTSSDSKEAKPVATAKPAASTPTPKPAAAADKDKAASAAATRYIVQIGAYSDAPSAHEIRMKAERAGLKTYTQVIGTDSSKKIRVRLGPFEDKAAADKAMATLKKIGLPGGLLTL